MVNGLRLHIARKNTRMGGLVFHTAIVDGVPPCNAHYIWIAKPQPVLVFIGNLQKSREEIKKQFPEKEEKSVDKKKKVEYNNPCCSDD